MTNAEKTLRGAILDGYASATGKPDEVESRIEAILQAIFQPQHQWAIQQYLKENAE